MDARTLGFCLLASCGPQAHLAAPDAGACAPPGDACTLDTPCCDNGAMIGQQTCLNAVATEGVCAVNCDVDGDCPSGQACDQAFRTDVIPHGICR